MTNSKQTSSYKLITGRMIEDFQRQINTGLDAGFELHGETFMDSNNNLYQAMIFKDNEND